jgi:hypothetical protein
MKEFPSNGAKLHDYEAFIAIVDTGNLTKAAARLRRSLQSVSRSLSALEAQLGSSSSAAPLARPGLPKQASRFNYDCARRFARLRSQRPSSATRREG